MDIAVGSMAHLSVSSELLAFSIGRARTLVSNSLRFLLAIKPVYSLSLILFSLFQITILGTGMFPNVICLGLVNRLAHVVCLLQ